MSAMRYELELNIETISPLHSGGVDQVPGRTNDQVTPQCFARDGWGRPILTGRSIKGAVRAAVTQYLSTEKGKTEYGDLESLTPWIWGNPGISEVPDRDADDKMTSRAAILTFHSVVLPLACATSATKVDGDDAKHADADTSTSDGEVCATPQDSLPQRHGIAVDRYWGGAADTALFAHEFLPIGHSFTVTISANIPALPAPGIDPNESPVTADKARRLLSLVAGLFKAGYIRLGARQNAGWGRVTLVANDPVRLSCINIESKQSVLRWLTSASTETAANGADAESLANTADAGVSQRNTPSARSSKTDEEFAVAELAPQRLMRIIIKWTSPTGILVADGVKPSEEAKERAKAEKKPIPTRQLFADPRIAPKDGKDKPVGNGWIVLPGSSVRGALRSRASRIANTVLYSRLQGSATEAFNEWRNYSVHRQLAEESDLIHDLFGSTCNRGALSVLDTHAVHGRIEKDRSKEDHSVDDTDRDPTSKKRGLGEPRITTHNAGDRWTGGVADGALYSEAVYDLAQWDDIVLEIDLDRWENNIRYACNGKPPCDQYVLWRQKAAWCLLGLTLAELAAGTLPLGGRGTRGLGQVEVHSIKVSGADPLDVDWTVNWKDTLEGSSMPNSTAAAAFAKKILERIKKAADGLEPNPRNPDANWIGWSSYLVSMPKEACDVR